MDKLFLPTTRARNLFVPDRCSFHLLILSRARLWLWATESGAYQGIQRFWVQHWV